MAIRFADHKESIEAVGKAAKRTGITELRDFDDVVPLMFSHAAYKSYPAALLDRKRYDLLTAWLDKLTKHDLSQVDVSGCTDIDSWIEALDAQTPLEVITSSGTTGTLRSSRRTGPGPRSRCAVGWSCTSRPSARCPRRTSSSPRST